MLLTWGINSLYLLPSKPIFLVYSNPKLKLLLSLSSLRLHLLMLEVGMLYAHENCLDHVHIQITSWNKQLIFGIICKFLLSPHQTIKTWFGIFLLENIFNETTLSLKDMQKHHGIGYPTIVTSYPSIQHSLPWGVRKAIRFIQWFL